MHEVIAAAVDPTTALSVGLKVDADALPQAVKDGIASGAISLTSPATTIALLKLDAVVGLEGTVETVNGADRLTRAGITCALCDSTVDDSFAPGIGKRLDGWANRDLDSGAIIALSPAVDAAEKARLNAWGAGMYDPRHNVDGLSKPVVIPPASGLSGVQRITATGDGADLAYWNRYVAATQMGGLGSFSDPRLPLAVTNGTEDRVSGKLAALQGRILVRRTTQVEGSLVSDQGTRTPTGVPGSPRQKVESCDRPQACTRESEASVGARIASPCETTAAAAVRHVRSALGASARATNHALRASCGRPASALAIASVVQASMRPAGN